MKLPSLRKLKDISGKIVLVRADFDVPVKNGKAAENGLTRIRRAVPTIEYLRKRGARIVLLTHLGRPRGRRVLAYSTEPISAALQKILGARIGWAPAVAGKEAKQKAAQLKNGETFLLQNARFDPGEEANSPKFARALAELADIYVNEAFGSSHRKHASIVGVPKLLPSYAGLHFEEEVRRLSKLLESQKRPYVVILGGAKIETKFPLIRKFLAVADYVLVGGALAVELGRRRETTTNPKLMVPIDTINENGRPADIGPKTIKKFSRIISTAKTIVWNGPLGVFEKAKYAKGSRAVAREINKSAKTGAYAVVGGGDTIACVGGILSKKYVWISTGGGAMLKYLRDGTLPGIEALCKSMKNR